MNKLALFLSDLVSLAAAFVLVGHVFAHPVRVALGKQTPPVPISDLPQLRILIFSMVAIAVLVWLLAAKGHYHRRKPFWDEVAEIWQCLLWAALVDAAALFLAKLPFSRITWSLSWISALILLPLLRIAVKKLLLAFGDWKIPTLIVGSGAQAAATWRAMVSDNMLGYEVRGFVLAGDAPQTTIRELAASAGLPLYLDIDEAQRARPSSTRGQIVLALEPQDIPRQAHWIAALSGHDRDLVLAPPLHGMPLHGLDTTYFFSHDILLMRVRNKLARKGHILLKRAFDIVGASIGLLLLSPFFLAASLLIRRDGGPAMFKHKRVGQNGEEFGCYKFRTMVPDAELALRQLLERDLEAAAQWARDRKLRNDPRVTPLGRFLRRSSLDELPQLINVLWGEMSLVGPRPVVRAELERYGDDLQYYLEAKPGITGLWQVSGRNDLDYAQRVFLDTWYVRNWALWHDIVILLKTVKVVFRQYGAY
ncbi:MAG: undecaprenyl-phosphate galactose phosphotransferase WbaP [Candidatus Protistobacter heckmanni]|nr:undecaprenyl-phosphate galactose phosphotransferase WbaP [Candidatus Protistobacter heckmanni]